MAGTNGKSTMPYGVRQAWGLAGSLSKPGPKSNLSIESITVAAVGLADADGVRALSLGRIAERLGITPNALYRYVDSRDDLDVIVHDHALGVPADIDSAPRWVEAAAAWCHALRRRYVVHPWLSDVRIRVPFALNSLAWLEELLGRLAPSGFTDQENLQAAALLDGYVRTRAAAARDLADSRGDALDGRAFAELVGPELLTQRLPRVSALISGGSYREQDADSDADFAFGLNCILDGLQDAAARLPSDR